MKRPTQHKLRGASMLSKRAWLEISSALGVTKRESQIIQTVFDNLSQKEIATRLAITEHTAHTHLNRLYKKLNVNTRAELILRVVEQMIALTLSKTGVLPPLCPRHHSGDCCRHISAPPIATAAQ